MLTVIRGTIHPISSEIIKNGVLIIENGMIKRVGSEHSVPIPNDANIIELPNAHITPGFIDPHTHIGLALEEFIGDSDVNEATNPITPALRVIDAIDTKDPAFKRAIEAGITTVGILPGSANLIGGLGAALHTYGNNINEQTLKFPIGMKMAFGENPKKTYKKQKKTPTTRMANTKLIREAFLETLHYIEKQKNANQNENDKKKKKPFKQNLDYQALSELLAKKLVARIHAHRSDDILAALRIAIEFDFELWIDHATESHLIIDQLKAQKNLKGCVVGPIMTARYKFELRNRTAKTPGILVKNNILTALTSDHPVLPVYYLKEYMHLAIKHGLPKEHALKTVTLNSATALGLENILGTLEEGKRADIVIFNNDPLKYESTPKYVLIDGNVVFSD